MILLTRAELAKYREMKKAGTVEAGIKPREFLKLIGVHNTATELFIRSVEYRYRQNEGKPIVQIVLSRAEAVRLSNALRRRGYPARPRRILNLVHFVIIKNKNV